MNVPLIDLSRKIPENDMEIVIWVICMGIGIVVLILVIAGVFDKNK